MRASSKKLPIVTLLVAAAAMLVGCSDGAQRLLLYDRGAILEGELWRLVTAPVVHFSMEHLVCDLAAFGVAGVLAERTHSKRFGCFLLLASLGINTTLFVAIPDVQRCAGLSGIAVAAAIYAALFSWASFRWLSITVVSHVFAKIGSEAFSNELLFVSDYAGPLQNGFIAHSLGAACGVVWFLCACNWRNARPRDGRKLRERSSAEISDTISMRHNSGRSAG